MPFEFQTTVSDCDEAFQEIRKKERQGSNHTSYTQGRGMQGPAEIRDSLAMNWVLVERLLAASPKKKKFEACVLVVVLAMAGYEITALRGITIPRETLFFFFPVYTYIRIVDTCLRHHHIMGVIQIWAEPLGMHIGCNW